MLTDAKLRQLKPKEKPYKVADFEGLFVLVTPAGSRLWKFKYRFERKEKRMSLGSYPATSLQDARKRKDEARGMLELGLDPSAEKQKAKNQRLAVTEHVFAKFAEAYLGKKRREGRADSTLSKLEWIIAEVNAQLGDRPIKEITAPEILKVLRRREAMEHYETAKKMRSVIGAVFRMAVAEGHADFDPTFALKDALIRGKTIHRAAITDRESLERYIKALGMYKGQAKTRLGLLLLTLFATRPSELRLAKWSEFDWEKKVWDLPAERMKMRKPHAVPLSDLALETLAELKEHTGWSELLFPGQSPTGNKPISENTFNQALRRMGFGPKEATSHGFRATFSTFANESGLWNPDAIETYCARLDKNEVRRAYNRAAYWDDRVKMSDWWARELMGLNNR